MPRPFLKWAGGKRQLLPKLLPLVPPNYNRYVEPFLGGGALFFELMPKNAILNDINQALINTYLWTKFQPKKIEDIFELWGVKLYQEGKKCFTEAVEYFNSFLIQDRIIHAEAAALFIFLNKTSFNGIYRLNSKGLYNVPWNNVRNVSFDFANYRQASQALATATLSAQDYSFIYKDAREGDFIFIDSPYVPITSTTFEAYTKEGFHGFSHLNLAMTLRQLTKRGVKIIATNYDSSYMRKLYEGFRIEVVDVRRTINSDGSNRRAKEVIIRNFDVDSYPCLLSSSFDIRKVI